MSGPVTGKPVVGKLTWLNMATTPVTLVANGFQEIVNTGTPAATVYLPLASTCVNGYKVSFKNMGGAGLTVSTALGSTDKLWLLAASPAGSTTTVAAPDATVSFICTPLGATTQWILV